MNAWQCFDLNLILMLGIAKVQPNRGTKLVPAVYLVKSEKFLPGAALPYCFFEFEMGKR